jgi:glycosyltransferase involved in cell wall biosynthesis
MRIVLIIPTLGSGGAERVMARLANGLAERGHGVWLVTLADVHADFYPVASSVTRVGLGLINKSESSTQALGSNLGRVCALRRFVRATQPQAVVSFMTTTNVLTLLACMGLGARVVVSERIDPWSHREHRLWAALRALTYRRADVIVTQTGDAASWFRRRFAARNIVVIPNPAPDGSLVERVSMPLPRSPYLLAAGRLERQKGHDLLIRAFASMAREHAHLQLAIAGEGSQAQSLSDLCKKLQLGDRVVFLGQVRDLAAVMRGAEAFVLSSRYEGFPNVLLEALANNVPIVATDCPGGPREILRNGEFGLLVPCDDPAALASALRRVVTDTSLRTRLGELAPTALERYEFGTVLASWESQLGASATDRPT